MKHRQRAHLKLITESISNLEKIDEFYIRRLKEGTGNKNMLNIQIEILRAGYEVEKNPVFLWRAIKTCIEAAIDFPEWITDYLLKASCKIMDSAYNPIKSEKDILADALKFKSRGSSNNFTKYIPTLKHYIRVSEVMHKKMESDLSFEKIEAQIANEIFPDDVDADAASTEVRKLRTLRERLQKIPIDLDLG